MAKKFTQRETEQLIAGIREAYETKIRQLQYRLDGLVAENRSLRASLSEYKNKENRIGRAIVAAEEKGEEIREFYRVSAETEWKTLQLFAEKWKNLAAQMAGLIPQGEAERYAEFAENLSALLGKESGYFTAPSAANQEQDEDNKITAQPEEFDPKAVIGKYMDGEEETGFNLDDVINPKGVLDLEKLCRSLGLMEDDSSAEQAEKPKTEATEREFADQKAAGEGKGSEAKPSEQTAVRNSSVAQPSALVADRNTSAAQPAVQQAMRIAAAAKPAAQSYLRPAMPQKPSEKTQKNLHGVKKFQPPR